MRTFNTLPLMVLLSLLTVQTSMSASLKDEKSSSLAEGIIASIDMNQVYVASGAAKTLVEKARENGKAAEEKVQLIMSAPYLTLPEFSEFAALAAKEQPTADESAKIKQFKANSDKGAMEVKTFREQGYDIVSENWFGFSAPAGLSPAIAARLDRAIREVIALPAVQEQFQKLGVTAAPMGPAEFTRFVTEQIVVWRPRIITAGAVEN